MTIHLADMPMYCAGCHNQDPSLRHVDMDSALDRGYGKVETIQVAYDDAIFCENCVKEGAHLLGMIEADQWQAEKMNLEKQLTMERKLREQAQRYADTLEDAVSHRPEPIKLDHRKKPRQLREEQVA
ncbi:MAG TPA: hypothetical protein VMT20_06970 [Terriglobia bacterium]|nr:hypothetical protein [Terriglobia bacterium]